MYTVIIRETRTVFLKSKIFEMSLRSNTPYTFQYSLRSFKEIGASLLLEIQNKTILCLREMTIVRVLDVFVMLMMFFGQTFYLLIRLTRDFLIILFTKK